MKILIHCHLVDSDLTEKWDFTLGTPIMAQNELAYALGATENLLEPVDAELHDGKTVIQVTETGYYYGYYTMKDAKTITATTGNRTRTFSKCDMSIYWIWAIVRLGKILR